MIILSRIALKRGGKKLKRIFDVVISISILICASPILALISALVRWNLGKPVIFKQQRPGLNEKPFYIYKFRTMTDDCDADGQLLPDYVRLTKFGKFLRKYSLDELLQLVNVIKGDLSIVGPRPLLMEYLPLYTVEQAKRHYVKPGITGWAQINGRNAISWEEKFDLDVWYVEHYSFLLDIRILFLTVIKVFKSEGIQNKENEPMPVFKGSNGSNIKKSNTL
jgi:sugar transferase EpsL